MSGTESESYEPAGVSEAIFHPAAEREMLADARYYEQQRPGLGEGFLDEVDRAVAVAVNHPESGTPLGGTFRWVLTRRFRYAVIYREHDERIEVVAVAHLRRRPGYWHRRV